VPSTARRITLCAFRLVVESNVDGATVEMAPDRPEANSRSSPGNQSGAGLCCEAAVPLCPSHCVTAYASLYSKQ
jgi:hypothetical protein